MSERTPTHICMDCGALGYSGGYHDHGGDNAGDTASFADLLKLAQRAGDALDALEWLVALKDGPRDERYEREKPEAWAAAREAIAAKGTR